MSQEQGWFESKEDYRSRVAREADENTIERSTGSAPSQGLFENNESYRERIAEEANERTVADSTGSAPSQGWFENNESYRERIAQEANERIVADSTGSAPSHGWFESADDYDVRIRKDANEQLVKDGTGSSPRQGWFEGNHEYRSRIAHQAHGILARDRSDFPIDSTASDNSGYGDDVPFPRRSGTPPRSAIGASASTDRPSTTTTLSKLFLIVVVGVAAILLFDALNREEAAEVAPANLGGWTDLLADRTSGVSNGVQYVVGPGGVVAQFRQADHSRIEYPGRFPAEGTFELWILVESGYGYEKGQLTAGSDTAVVFSTDNAGKDVAWPGAATLLVNRDGTLEFTMTTVKYGLAPNEIVKAIHSRFQFNEWHSIGVSWGSEGQSLVLDGKAVAREPTHQQRLGFGGTHKWPKDVPTVGETVSCFWPAGQYAQGFEGRVARVRVSGKQEDWLIAKGMPFK